MTWKDTYLQWKNDDNLDKELREQLMELEKDASQLEDAFYAPLEFGTAGMRGIIGPGINRMNIYTVRQATEGLAEFMEELGEVVKKQGVAIAYDSRHKSPEFAMEAAKTLAYHDIPSFVFESLRPTPELSFAVRELGCYAGIMITASHNPAAYNGYKIYGNDGAQMPPKDADLLTSYVRKVSNPLIVEVIDDATVENSELISIIGEEVDRKYLDLIQTVTINKQLVEKEGKDLKLIYTPLHGTGKMLGERALTEAGFKQFKLVPEQAIADPNFSTVKSPNPEEKTAFEYAIRLGKQENADILIATDPDADRLGAAVRLPDSSYEVISGNQIGALLIHYILEAHKQAGTLPDNAVVLKSIVSSELGTVICDDYNVKMVNVLTGFKFIAEKIQQYEEDNSQTFMFGFEESYGFLVKPFVRDKDAIQALVLLAEVAAFYKNQNKTLYDALQDLFKKYGYYEEKTISVTLSGIEGSQKIKAIMEKCRKDSPKEFGNVSVVETEDFKFSQKISNTGLVETIEFDKSDVLKYKLEDGSWIAIRPSGTEPKIKFYIGVVGETQNKANEKIALFESSIQALVN